MDTVWKYWVCVHVCVLVWNDKVNVCDCQKFVWALCGPPRPHYHWCVWYWTVATPLPGLRVWLHLDYASIGDDLTLQNWSANNTRISLPCLLCRSYRVSRAPALSLHRPPPSSLLSAFLSSVAVNWTPSSMMRQYWTTWPAEMRAVSWWLLEAGN